MIYKVLCRDYNEATVLADILDDCGFRIVVVLQRENGFALWGQKEGDLTTEEYRELSKRVVSYQNR